MSEHELLKLTPINPFFVIDGEYQPNGMEILL
mgnify:CR=1 FL=1